MDYIKLIEDNKENMISFLQELVRIDTVQDKPCKMPDGEICPFGKGVNEAYHVVLDKAKSWGMGTCNVDNYGGHIEMVTTDDKEAKTMGMLAHLDVVPVDKDGWSYPPFSGELKDGYVYGRGTQDDKGPLVAALYAMKALKYSGVSMKKNVRLILGLDEETGSTGMEYYFNHQEKPDFAFTPDGEFPVVKGEKGMMIFELAKKIAPSNAEGIELSKLEGGKAPNMVAEQARAVIRAKDTQVYDKIKEQIHDFSKETGFSLKCKGVGKSLEISALGKASHGAMPEKGVNAISILFRFIGQINFSNDEINEFIDFYNKYIGFELDGKSLGCGFNDEISGNLIFNVGQLKYDKKALGVVINIRYPISFDEDKVYDAIKERTLDYDIGIVKQMHNPPLYFDENEKLVKTLLSVYREYSGDVDSKPLVIGGGTYARSTQNCVCFGGLFPGDEDRMHQKDERILVERVVDMAKIYAEAIYRLCVD